MIFPDVLLDVVEYVHDVVENVHDVMREVVDYDDDDDDVARVHDGDVEAIETGNDAFVFVRMMMMTDYK
jgi:hypothetical protein